MRIRLTVAGVLALTFAATAFASALNTSTRIQGTILFATASSLTIVTASGKQTIAIAPHARVFNLTKSSLDQVTNGSFIGTTVVPQPDGTYKSTEVHVFAPALRGMGEGFTKMNSSGSRMMANATVRVPVNMMANSTVHSVSANGGGKTISMTFSSGKKVIHIPAATPVSYLSPGTKTLIGKGKSVLLICSGQPGKFTAKTIVLSEDPALLQR